MFVVPVSRFNRGYPLARSLPFNTTINHFCFDDPKLLHVHFENAVSTQIKCDALRLLSKENPPFPYLECSFFQFLDPLACRLLL